MNFLKIFLTILGIALVLGFFYFLTLLGPGKPVPPDLAYIDYEEESVQILAESEKLEAEFEDEAASGIITEESLQKLRRAIRLQEIYINQARILDQAPTDRLNKLQRRIQDIEAQHWAELVEDLEKQAKSAEDANDPVRAMAAYKEAYDLQSKINSEYNMSKYRDIRKPIYFDRQVKMIEAKPLYMESLEVEKAARKAVEEQQWELAQEKFEKAISLVTRMHSEYPSSGYTDIARLQRMDIDLASLRSTKMQEQIEGILKKASDAEEAGDTLKASEAYGDAAAMQRDLNRLFPKSMHASEEKATLYEKKKNDAYSWQYGKEIIDRLADLDKALVKGDVALVSELTSGLIRKYDQFKSDFPKSEILGEDIGLRLRYISFMIRDIERVNKIVNENLKPISEGDSYEMFKTEIPQEFFSLIMQENPSRYSNPQHPVDSVTYDEVKRFCTRLSWLLAREVELPTEEMFKRAAGSMRYADLNEISWNIINSDGLTHQIATKKPNDRGFYDLLGNVAEFIKNETDNAMVLTLGGSAQTSTDAMMEYAPAMVDPKQRNRMNGFRIVIHKAEGK